MSKYDALFQPMKVGSVTIKNRIVMCPMGGTALIENNHFEQESADMYIERAKGGVGLIVPGIIHITDMWGRGTWTHEVDDTCMEKVRETLKELHKYDCKMFAQIGAGMGRVLSIKSGMLPPGFNPVKEQCVALQKDFQMFGHLRKNIEKCQKKKFRKLSTVMLFYLND